MSSVEIMWNAATGLRLQWDKPGDDGAPAPFAIYDAHGAEFGPRYADRVAAVEAFTQASVAAARGLRPCRFYFVDDPTYPGFTDGTTWNGFANVWVTPATRDLIAAAVEAEGDPDGQTLESLRALTPDESGLISLANGWAAELEA